MEKNLVARDGYLSFSDIVWGIVAFQHVSLAVLVTLLYDIVITYDQEVIHMYNSRLSPVKVLWFLNRILVPVQVGVHVFLSFWPNQSTSLCFALGQTLGNWIVVLNIFVIQALLALRTAAIYERSRRVSLFIATLVIGSTVSRIVIVALNPVPNILLPGPPNGALLCFAFPFKQNLTSFAGPVIPLIVDATLYVMTVWRLYQQSYPNFGPRIRRTHSLFPLLYRDGAIYLLVVAAAMAASTVGFSNQQLLGALTASDLYIVACSIACSRLILHLKESSRQNIYRNRDIPTSWEPPHGLTPSRVITMDEYAFGFGADPSTDESSPVISGTSEDIDTRSSERDMGRAVPEMSMELSSFSPALCPIRPSASEGE